MTLEELEAAILRLDPKARARLAEKLLRSLEALSEQESAELWADGVGLRDCRLRTAVHGDRIGARSASARQGGQRMRLRNPTCVSASELERI